MELIEIQHVTKDYGTAEGSLTLISRSKKAKCLVLLVQMVLVRRLHSSFNGISKTSKWKCNDKWVGLLEGFREIKKWIGYIPGEIAFPDAPTGTDFFKRQADLLGLKDMSYIETIIEKLQLDPTAKLKRMSKGMKQKTAIVAALMADPEGSHSR